ncbi:MAG: hypothetical protein Q8L71_06265 [Thiobacillus sp.]|nr:hypothetical protein [Thiobacillus sp.]
MSDSPLLSKMDALLKKHRGGVKGSSDSSPEQAAPPDAWLPVLTHVIERGTPPVVPMAAASPTVTPPTLATPPAESVALAAEVPPSAGSDTLAEQLMSELAPRLSEVMEKQIAAKLRKNLDQTVASLLSQIDVNVREIVREAVAEKLKQPRDPSA